MATIHTKLKINGRFHTYVCYGTIDGYDVTFEHEYVSEAMIMMYNYLTSMNIDNATWYPIDSSGIFKENYQISRKRFRPF